MKIKGILDEIKLRINKTQNMKFIRFEKQIEDNGKITVKEVSELPWLSILPIISILLSTFTSLYAVYSISNNAKESRDFELFKISYEEKYKAINELMNSTAEIMNHVNNKNNYGKVPDSMIGNFDKIYNTKLALFYCKNHDVLQLSQSFKYKAIKWENLKTFYRDPSELKIVKEKLIKTIQKDLNTDIK